MRYTGFRSGAAAVCFAAGTLQMAMANEPPPVRVASAPAKDSSTVCVQVKIGTDKPTDFHCLNSLMQKMVDQESLRRAALQAAQDGVTQLAPTQVGLFNETAVHERLGTSFGHSAFPQRPSKTYVVPLIH